MGLFDNLLKKKQAQAQPLTQPQTQAKDPFAVFDTQGQGQGLPTAPTAPATPSVPSVQPLPSVNAGIAQPKADPFAIFDKSSGGSGSIGTGQNTNQGGVLTPPSLPLPQAPALEVPKPAGGLFQKYLAGVKQRTAETKELRAFQDAAPNAQRTKFNYEPLERQGVVVGFVQDPKTGYGVVEFSGNPSEAVKKALPGVYDAKRNVWTVTGVGVEPGKVVANVMFALQEQQRKGTPQDASLISKVGAGITRVGDVAANVIAPGNPYQNRPELKPSTGNAAVDSAIDTVGWILGMKSGQGVAGVVQSISQPAAMAAAPQMAKVLNVPVGKVIGALETGTRMGLFRGGSAMAEGEDALTISKETAKGVGLGAAASVVGDLAGKQAGVLLEKLNVKGDSLLGQTLQSMHSSGTFYAVLGGGDAALAGKDIKEIAASAVAGYGTGAAFSVAEIAMSKAAEEFKRRGNDLAQKAYAHYTLGVGPMATEEEIKKAWRTKITQARATLDRYPTGSTEGQKAATVFARIQMSYDLLNQAAKVSQSFIDPVTGNAEPQAQGAQAVAGQPVQPQTADGRMMIPQDTLVARGEVNASFAKPAPVAAPVATPSNVPSPAPVQTSAPVPAPVPAPVAKPTTSTATIAPASQNLPELPQNSVAATNNTPAKTERLIEAPSASEVTADTEPQRAVWERNKTVLEKAETGKPVEFAGLRYGDKGKAGETGVYYGLEPNYVTRYENGQELTQEAIKLNNPIVVDGELSGGGKLNLVMTLAKELDANDPLKKSMLQQFDKMEDGEWEQGLETELDKLIAQAATKLGYDGVVIKRKGSFNGTNNPTNDTEIIAFPEPIKTVPQTALELQTPPSASAPTPSNVREEPTPTTAPTPTPAPTPTATLSMPKVTDKVKEAGVNARNLHKIENDLTALTSEDSEVTPEQVLDTLKVQGKVRMGFDAAQREQITTELVEGLVSKKEQTTTIEGGKKVNGELVDVVVPSINVKVRGDGQINVVKTPEAVARYLDTIDVKDTQTYGGDNAVTPFSIGSNQVPNMIANARKAKKLYYIRQSLKEDTRYIEVEKASPLRFAEHPQLEAFVHKGKDGWVVTDAFSGMAISLPQKTKDAAIANTKERIAKYEEDKGAGSFYNLMADFIKNNDIISPRYYDSAQTDKGMRDRDREFARDEVAEYYRAVAKARAEGGAEEKNVEGKTEQAKAETKAPEKKTETAKTPDKPAPATTTKPADAEITKLKADIAMYDDAIKTNPRQAEEKGWLDKRDDAATKLAQLEGKIEAGGEVVRQRPVGGLPAGFIPVNESQLKRIEKTIQDAIAERDALQKKTGMGAYYANLPVSKVTTKEGKEMRAYSKSSNAAEDKERAESLDKDVLPELVRQKEEIEKRLGKGKEEPKPATDPADVVVPSNVRADLAGDAAPTATAPAYTVTSETDTRNDSPLWVLRLEDKLEKEAFDAFRTQIKELGGNWSGFKKGFIFREDPAGKLDGLGASGGAEKKAEAPKPVPPANVLANYPDLKPGIAPSNVREESADETPTTAPTTPTTSPNVRAAEKLRTVADNMQEKINGLRNPNRQTNTARRASMAAGAAEDADRQELIQRTMRNIANGLENSEVDKLSSVSSRAEIEMFESLLYRAKSNYEQYNKIEYMDSKKREVGPEDVRFSAMPFTTTNKWDLQRLVEAAEKTPGLKRIAAKLNGLIPNRNYDGAVTITNVREEIMKVADELGKDFPAPYLKDSIADYKRLQKLGINSDSDLRAAMTEYLTFRASTRTATKQDAIREKQRALIGSKIPGYFPTPKEIVTKMLEAAEIDPSHKVLEPSAGQGHIADAIGVGKVDTVELNPSNREILTLKGHKIVGEDALEVTGTYDRIVMNPPFENGMDAEHVRHAYETNLAPGGRLVSIMGEGSFFRSDKKAVAFREWLESVRGTREKLPDGAFKSSDRPTGVATRMVVIDKPVKDGVPTASVSTSNVRKAQESLGKEIDAAIGDVTPPVGFSVKVKGGINPPQNATTGPTASPAPLYKSTDPNVEARIKAAHGLTSPTFWEKTKDFLDSIGRKATRDFEWLPGGKEFAQLRFDLRELAKQKDVAGDTTLRLQQGITIAFKDNPKQFALFERKVLLDDLMEEAAAGHALPFGYTQDVLEADHKTLEQVLTQYPDVKDAVDKRKSVWDAIKADYITAQQAIGHNVDERFTKTNYFRHQILEYANIRGLTGTGAKLKTPSGRGFLKQREGSALDINTNYLEAEYEVMAQMLYDIEVAKIISAVDRSHNVVAQVKAKAKAVNASLPPGSEKVSWRELVPDGYVIWQPKEGNVFYFADSIPAQLAEKLYAGAMQQIGIKADDISKVLVKGQRLSEFVIKEEVAKTLDNLVRSRQIDPVRAFTRSLLGKWKQWQLVSPPRAVKYNLRNITGDVDAAFVGNPSTFTKVPQATRELYQVFYGDKSMTPTMREWFERGGMQSTLQVQEMGDINRLKMFKDMLEAKGTVKEIPLKIVQGYWEKVRLGTDFREAILRYAAYADYLEQMQKNNGVPKNFGASLREEVMALADVKDRAFMLANDLLGAYDSISVLGQEMREYLLPFWSWKEVNAKRYYRFFKNAAYDRDFASSVGRTAFTFVKRSPMIAAKLGAFALKAMAMWALTQVWNSTRFAEQEASLPEDVRDKPHIILGVDKNGKTLYLSGIGALADIMDWFALESPQALAREYMSGRKSLVEVGKEMFFKAPVNTLFQSLGPQYKTPAELITGKKTYPDIFEPGMVRDNWQYLAQSVGLGDLYDYVKGLPTRPDALQRSLTLVSDPGEAAYYEALDAKREYLKSIGKYSNFSSSGNEKSKALYNVKLAARYGDKQAFEKYLYEYAKYGGTLDSLDTSLQNMDPLDGLNAEQKKEFVATWLDAEGRSVLKRADTFYRSVILKNAADYFTEATKKK